MASSCAPSAGYCPLPVRADACVKDWLLKQSPPYCVRDYLWRIGVQQTDLENNCD